MLTYIVDKLTWFTLRLMAGELLALIQFIIVIILGFFVHRTWTTLMRRPFFRAAMITILCCVAFGFLFMPEQMITLINQITEELTKAPSER